MTKISQVKYIACQRGIAAKKKVKKQGREIVSVSVCVARGQSELYTEASTRASLTFAGPEARAQGKAHSPSSIPTSPLRGVRYQLLHHKLPQI